MCLSKIKAAIFAVLALFVPVLCAQLPPQMIVREWKIGEEPDFRAGLVSFDGSTAILRPAAGAVREISLEDLGEEDRRFLEDWLDKQPVVIPDAVGVDGAKVPVEIVSEDDVSGRFVYRTPHFEFISEGKLTQVLLRDVARNFEATYELIKALPWGIDPRPENGDRFRAFLVRSRSRYEEEGAPKNSGGVYFRSRAMFIVPFESLGLKPQGNSFTKSADYTSETLVHELTHQMMNAWLAILPQWVVEGTAEYAGLMPLRLGTFRVSASKSGLRDYLDRLRRRGGVPEPYPLEKLFWVTNREWSDILAENPMMSQRLYFTSYLLVYFFMHLDGKGDGAQFVRYMREVGKTKREIETYRRALRTYEELNKSGQSNLPPPNRPAILDSEDLQVAFEKKTLGILLNGRTNEQLMDDIRSAYRRFGVRF